MATIANVSPVHRDFDIRIHNSPRTKANIMEIYRPGVKHKDITERFGISSSALKRLIKKLTKKTMSTNHLVKEERGNQALQMTIP